MDDGAFRRRILQHWRTHGRHDLPWRTTSNPYAILLSEVMLQQTQVDRVIPKYRLFLKTFPTFRALARASTRDVLGIWQGLGYNRRAVSLQRCAQVVTQTYRGRVPKTYEALIQLPGIGPYTAGALLAFAFNMPYPMIETNIRRVYLHHYFADMSGVADADLLPIIERTMDRRHPREWYWALMDYGSVLARRVPNPNRRSEHYVRQSKFEGSHRQLRGALVREALQGKKLVPAQLARKFRRPVAQVKTILAELSREGLLAVY